MSSKTGLTKLSVFLNVQGDDYIVGQLADVRGKIYFEYDSSFIEREIEISPFKLPSANSMHVDVSRNELYGLPGVFYDSLPDGWGLLVMDRAFKRIGIDPQLVSPLDRLGYLGSRPMGALRYEPEAELFDAQDYQPLDLNELAKESELILRGETEQIIKEIIVAGGSPGGARPKALIGLDANTDQAIYGSHDIPGGFEHYVVKFRGLEDPKTMGAVEYTYSKMAIEAGINMPDTRLLQSGGERFFAIKRFDRVGNHKIHMHTLGGLIHSNFRVPECSYDHLFKVTTHLTRNHSDLCEAFRRMIFNVLAFNCDDHVKNFCFLMNKNGDWSLSPAYDLVYSQGVRGWHAMDIGGKQNPGKKDVLNIAADHGIKKHQANAIIEQVEHTVSLWSRLANQHEVEKKVIKEIKDNLNQVKFNQ